MVTMQEKYDVVVVGAGHAGCEAARACARMGLKTAMVTMNLDLIAQMSCNPAIGGIAKGHLVREIDALGGVMGEMADAVGIQFRLLNTSRGPAVWSPRAQMDKKQYRVRMREVLEREPNLRIKQAEVAALRLEGGRAAGVLLARRAVDCRGRGDRDDRDIPEWSGARRARHGIAAAAMARRRRSCWAGNCGRLGLRWMRLKTGTPPRLDGRTIDWTQFERQPGRCRTDSVFVPDGAD